MIDPIEVQFKTISTSWGIRQELKRLSNLELLSFDVEARSLYTPEERDKARNLLKDGDFKYTEKKDLLLISNSSGLSHPSIVWTTHFVFGESDKFSTILVAENFSTELMIWRKLADFKTLLIIHNSLYDLKICHQRTGKLPENYLDTALIAKVLINDANNMNSRTGLKHLMGSYYAPAWGLFEDYDNPNLRDPKFLSYAAIDGAATYKLWELLQEEMTDE